MSRYLACETWAGITTHVRELPDGDKPCYTGHRQPQPMTLCGMGVGWDLEYTEPHDVRCSECLEALRTLTQEMT